MSVSVDDDGSEARVGSTARGGALWTYRHGARRRPCVHPLRTPAGRELSADAPADHPWHHALWFTVKFVDGDNFWEEYDAYGVLRHTSFTVVEDEPGHPVLTGELDWIRPDRTTVAIREHRSLRHVPLGDDAYAIDLELRLAPASDAVLDRTPFTTWGGYGGLAFRGRPDLRDTVIRLAPGGSGGQGDEVPGARAGEPVARVLGTRAPWLHLQGTAPGPDGAEGGTGPAGVALLDHPSNVRHPVPWYASTRAATYGDEGWSNFVNAAFLWDEPLTVPAGEPLRLRYRVVVHDGHWTPDQVAAEHARFVDGRGAGEAAP